MKKNNVQKSKYREPINFFFLVNIFLERFSTLLEIRGMQMNDKILFTKQFDNKC